MKNFIKSIAFVAIASVFTFVACEKEEIVQTQDQETIDLNKNNGETRALEGPYAYEGDCGFCFQRTEVCISPTNCDSWVCGELGGGWFFQNFALRYFCEGSSRTIPLKTFKNSTPVETFCFYIDLPINTPVYLSRTGGCAFHDFLCDIDVTFDTGIETSVTWDSEGGIEYFEIASRAHCAKKMKDKVKLDEKDR